MLEEFVQLKSARDNLSDADLLRMIADDQRSSHGSTPTPVENYLATVPQLQRDPDSVMDAIYSEMLIRQERGETPDEAEYVARFPELKQKIRRQFQLQAALDAGNESTGLDPLEDSQLSPDQVTADFQPNFPDIIIEGVCGRGGMGTVFHGRSTLLQRDIAVKSLARSVDAESPEARRMEREAQAVASLDDNHIVKIYDVRRDDRNLPTIIMEYVSGGTLAHRLLTGPMAAEQASTMLRKIASGVAAAHQAGLIHRDLKPANILLTERDEPKVADFGLVRINTHIAADKSSIAAFVGTPAYAAPEQARAEGAGVSQASDVYSLGVILYEMLTGRAPFQAATAWEVVSNVLNEDAAQVRTLNPRVPVDLETICHKCLEKSPERRYANADALHADLVRLADGRPILARRTSAVTHLTKWCRRNPLPACLVGIVMFSALSIITIAITSQQQISQALGKTQTALEIADNQRAVATRAMRDLVFSVHDTLEQRAASVAARGEVLQSAITGLEKIIESNPDNNDTKLTLAEAHHRFAYILSQQGNNAEAISEYQRAIEMIEPLPLHEARVSEAVYHKNLGQQYNRMAQFQEGIEQTKRSLTLLNPLLAADPENVKLRKINCQCKSQNSSVLTVQGDPQGAISMALGAREIANELHGEFPGDLDITFMLADANRNMASGYLALGSLGDFQQAYQWNIDLLQPHNPTTAENVQVRSRYFTAVIKVAYSELYQMQYDSAISGLREGADGIEALVAAEPERSGFRMRLGGVYGNLAEAHLAVGDYAACRRYADDSNEQFEKAIDLNPSAEVQRTQIAGNWALVAQSQIYSGDAVGCCDSLKRLLDNLQPLVEVYQMHAMFSNIQQTRELILGSAGLESTAAGEDIARARRSIEILQAAVTGDTAPLVHSEEALLADIQAATSMPAKALLTRWLAVAQGYHYTKLANANASSTADLDLSAQRCVDSIQQFELLEQDSSFHIITPAFSELRAHPIFQLAFPAPR